MSTTLPPVKIMAMGDSNTYGVHGYGDKESGGYRLYLDQKLKAAGLTFDMVGTLRNGHAGFDRDHEGYNGIQSDGLKAKIPGIMSANKPDVILLMSGSNDAKTDSVAKMKSDMQQLLDTIKAYAPGAKVLVAGVPPSREGNTANISPTKVAQYNADLPGLVAAKKAAGMKVSFVDSSSLTVNDISSLGVDSGVHLSEAGAQKLAGIWYNALRSLGVKDGTIDAGQGGSSGGSTGGTGGSTGGTGGSTGSGPVMAVDDSIWKTGVNETMWQNARYLTWNDQGSNLKVSAVASTSAAGGSVSFSSDGTIKFTPKAGWSGKDWVEYTVRDGSGNTDTGKFYVQVGSGTTIPTEPAPTSPPTSGDSTGGGTGSTPVAVTDDFWKTGVNETMWQSARYLTWNDKGGDGSLKVTAVASKSAAGGSISFGSDGTIKFAPKAGWSGKDAIQYTVSDADGSSDTGTFYVQVGSGGPVMQPADGSTGGGTGSTPTAVTDDFWKTGVNETMWQNARYLTWNDKGGDGSLKVTAVDAKSAAGGSVSFTGDGTIRFTPKAGWQGKDAIQYTVSDADGSSDTGTFYVQVGSGGPVMQPTDATSSPAPEPSTGGSGNPVTAYNDHWNAKANSSLWFNSRYVLQNDKAPDGGLAVKTIASTTTKGGKIAWDADTGTTVYRPKAGFIGKDYVQYTAVDADGSTDTALIHFDVLLA